jgi:hypothetical protein
MTYLGLVLVQAILWTIVNTSPSGGSLRDRSPHPTANTLTCKTGRPHRSWRGWRQTPGYDTYHSLEDLCGFKGFDRVQRTTMGCICQNTGLDGRSQQLCPRALADPSIYDNEYLQGICHKFCGCPFTIPNDGESPFEEAVVPGDAESAVSTTEESTDTASSEFRQPLIEEFKETCAVSGVGTCENDRVVDSLDFPTIPRLHSTATSESSPQVCGRGCTKYQCDGRAPGCRCIAHRFANTREQHYGACGLIPKQKRDGIEEPAVACPCNGTYITRACCDVADGIVHEDSSQNLGSMIDEKDVYDLAVEAFSLLRDSFFPERQESAGSDWEPISHDILRARSETPLPGLECGKDLPVPVPLPYASLTDLCGSQASQAATLGCHCSVNDGVSSLNCSASLAGSALHKTPLLALCQTKCFCSAASESNTNDALNSLSDEEFELFGLSGNLKEDSTFAELVLFSSLEGENDLKRRNATTEAEKSEHGQGLGGSSDRITPHGHTEQTVLSVGCLLLGVTLSIVGSALSWQEKGLRDRNDFSYSVTRQTVNFR